MDAVVKPLRKAPLCNAPLSDHVKAAVPAAARPSREEAEAAVRTLIAYAGDDPAREGVLETPKRVVDAYEELYSGYRECPAEVLDRTFNEIATFDDFVLVRDISFNSQCEHHMMPFMGKAHIAYKPVERVVGLSKLARLVDLYARRLQTQERLTAQIATAIDEILNPRGVAVLIEAEHMCMSLRGVEKLGASTITTQFIGSLILCARGAGGPIICICRARLDDRGRGRPRLDAEVRCRRACHLRHDRCRVGRGADGRTYECAGARPNNCDRRRLVLQPLAQKALAQGRGVRSYPARRRDAH